MTSNNNIELKRSYSERDELFRPMDVAERKKFKEILAIHERRMRGDPMVADVKHYLCDMGPDEQGRAILRFLDSKEFNAWINDGKLPDGVTKPPRLITE